MLSWLGFQTKEGRRVRTIVQTGMNQGESGAVCFSRRAFLHKTGALLAGATILPTLDELINTMSA